MTPPSLQAAAGSDRLVATTDAESQRVFRKIAWRFMPILSIAYVFNYLDRNNIGFAALSMNRDVGLTAAQFGYGAGILFLGYCFLEVPSNLVLYRVGARIWVARIMITWGLISAATIFVVGPKSWYLLRFLLGAAEAGFFPGVAFYLGTWFPSQYRTRMLAWFLVAIPISSVVGGPISGLLLEMHGVAGLAGWKWLFLLEGLPATILGIALLRILADRPENAAWLTEDERQIVRERIKAERREREVRSLGSALADPRVLILAGVQFGFLVGSYGVGIWLPQIIKAGRLSDLRVGFVSGGCYVAASLGMLVWAAHVDKRGGKIRHLALACLLSTTGLLCAIYTTNFWLSLMWVTVALVGITSARAIFWTIPPRFLTGMGAAGGLAFINSVGTMGGFVGPSVMGWTTERTGSFRGGLAAMAGALLMATCLAWLLKWFVTEE